MTRADDLWAQSGAYAAAAAAAAPDLGIFSFLFAYYSAAAAVKERILVPIEAVRVCGEPAGCTALLPGYVNIGS
jgi:hypothetical protein